MNVISEGNFTRVFNSLKDPDNRSYVVALAMTASAALCFFGYRCIKICQ